MSNSVRPYKRQPTRLWRRWDSPGKSTGVGCHFLLQCMQAKSEIEVAQSCLTLSNPMDCSPQGSSIHGIFQARMLEWGAIASPITLLISTKKKDCSVFTGIWEKMSSYKCSLPIHEHKTFSTLF